MIARHLAQEPMKFLAAISLTMLLAPAAHSAYAEADCAGTPTYTLIEDSCTLSQTFPDGSSRSASGYGSLASGIMRSVSQTTQIEPGSGGGAVASISLSDKINFGDTAAFVGELRLRIDGAFLGTLPIGDTSQSLLGALVVPFAGTARIDAYFDNGVLARLPTDFNEGTGQTNMASLTAGAVDVELVVPFSWVPNASPVSFVASLFAFAWTDQPGTQVANFGNTALLRVVVPAGQTFTSESGVLLTTPVPEPQSAFLLLAGAAFLSLRLGRLSRRTDA